MCSPSHAFRALLLWLTLFACIRLLWCLVCDAQMRNKEQQMRQTQAQMEVQLERAQRRIQKLQQENAALREVDKVKERVAPAALAPPPPLPPPPVSIAPAALPDANTHICANVEVER